MTRKTSHAGGRSQLRIGIPDELNHFACGLLLRFIVLLKLILYVAIRAVNAQRRLKRKHNLHQPVGRNSTKQLNVLVFLLSAFFFASRWKGIKRGKLSWRAGRSAGFGAGGV